MYLHNGGGIVWQRQALLYYNSWCNNETLHTICIENLWLRVNNMAGIRSSCSTSSLWYRLAMVGTQCHNSPLLLPQYLHAMCGVYCLAEPKITFCSKYFHDDYFRRKKLLAYNNSMLVVDLATNKSYRLPWYGQDQPGGEGGWEFWVRSWKVRWRTYTRWNPAHYLHRKPLAKSK